jgi:hypothetical protein
MLKIKRENELREKYRPIRAPSKSCVCEDMLVAGVD